MGSTRLCWTDGNQVDNISVYLREPLVKACQPAGVTARQLSQVGVGQLAMAYHASQRHVLIRNVVRPKLMARIGRWSTPRSTSVAGYELLGGATAKPAIAASESFFVPPMSSELIGVSAGGGGIPTNLEMVNEDGTPLVGFLGTPDLFGSPFDTTAAGIDYNAPEVPFGTWAAFVDDINGPYSTSPATPETLALFVDAVMNDFDLTTTTDTGDLWPYLLGLPPPRASILWF